MSNEMAFGAIRTAITALEEEGPHKSSHDADEERIRREAHNAALARVLECIDSIERMMPGAGLPGGGEAVESSTSKGVMMRISKFEDNLRSIRERFGNTCVYIRDATWGAAALNAFDDDSKQDAEDDRRAGDPPTAQAIAKSLELGQKPLPISTGSATWDRDGRLTRLTAVVGGEAVELIRADALSPRWWACVTERKRQIELEGFTAKHDAQYTTGQLAFAAASYAWSACFSGTTFQNVRDEPPASWPFDPSWWKPSDPRSDITKAIALLMAEWERLDNLPAEPV